jgi:rod shape-determining protein MreD
VKSLRLTLGLALAVLATLALGAMRFPAPPDFFLIVVAMMARGGAVVPALLAGLPAGLLEDALQGPSGLLGLHSFTKILVGYLLATIGARTIVEKPLAVGGLLAGAVLVEAVTLTFLLGRAVSTGLLGGALQAASRVPWRQRRDARRRMRLN